MVRQTNVVEQYIRRAPGLLWHEQYIEADNIIFPFQGKFSGSRMLAFGCGPSIHEVISASAWYNEIHVAEYVGRNRKQVEQWRDKSPHAFNWMPYFETYASLEG